MGSMGTDPPPALPADEPSGINMAVIHTDLPEQMTAAEACPPANQPTDVKLRVDDLRPRTRAGFLYIYGWMGVPMVMIFLMSAAWTFMLAVIQQIPTQIANYLMDTADLDYGEFWLLPKPESALSISAILLLVLFGIGYLGLVVLMVFPDKMMPVLWNHASHMQHRLSTTKPIGTSEPVPLALPGTSNPLQALATDPKIRPIDTLGGDARGVQEIQKMAHHSLDIPVGLSWERLKYEVTSPDGLLRQYYNPLLDLPKLIFQTITLFTYLHNGFPIVVICVYSCALFTNWMISCYRYKRERPDPHFIACRIFYSFDLFFAVFAPLEVLCVAYFSFHFERAEFATRVATISTGSFDRTARLFADPTEVSMFRIAVHYLQFTTTGSLLVKSALNVLSLFKWGRTIAHLIEHARSSPSPRASLRVNTFERTALAKLRRRKQLQNLLVASLFLCAGTAVFIFSIVAVVSTRNVCRSHPQCKVTSYQWNVGAEHCSCIVFVDRAIELRTFAEWENPPDATASLANLAATGHLRIVQIINRQVETLPIELRRCHALEQLILIYTKTLAIPDWAKEFTHLEYLHIEGDLTAKQLTYMPLDLFAGMPHLLFLHLGCLVKLPAIPNLDHLEHLQYLVLAMLHSVTTIPSLSRLRNLQRLNIIDAIQVYELPSIQALDKLKSFALTSRNPVCCNGYMTGSCDLNNFSCLNRTASGEPLVECTSKHVSPADYEKMVVSTEGLVCPQNITFDLKNGKPSYELTDVACGGVKYKRCMVRGVVGICYPARMQPVSCQLTAPYLALRRLQIERGVGSRCDPAIEAWLGCKT